MTRLTTRSSDSHVRGALGAREVYRSVALSLYRSTEYRPIAPSHGRCAKISPGQARVDGVLDRAKSRFGSTPEHRVLYRPPSTLDDGRVSTYARPSAELPPPIAPLTSACVEFPCEGWPRVYPIHDSCMRLHGEQVSFPMGKSGAAMICTDDVKPTKLCHTPARRGQPADDSERCVVSIPSGRGGDRACNVLQCQHRKKWVRALR